MVKRRQKWRRGSDRIVRLDMDMVDIGGRRVGLSVSPPAGKIVAVCECKGVLYVATESRVYSMVDGVFRPLVFSAEVKEP